VIAMFSEESADWYLHGDSPPAQFQAIGTLSLSAGSTCLMRLCTCKVHLRVCKAERSIRRAL
jgi:hypothetical protein